MLCFAETSEKKDRPPPPPPRRSSLASSVSTVPSPAKPSEGTTPLPARSSFRRSGRQRRSRRLSCLSNCERQAEVVVANAEQVKRRVLASLHVRSCSIARCENLERNSAKVLEANRSLSPDTSHGARPASCMAITEGGNSDGNQTHRTATNASGADSGGLTIDELRQISARQQRQIESQRQRLSEKTTRLQQLRRKDAVRKKSNEVDDNSAKLRTRIGEQEVKIRQAVATRMQVNEFKFSNENMALELDSLKTSFAEKQRELSRYTQRVEELKVALEQLRSNASTKFGARGPELAERGVLKPPSKLPAPGLIQAVNTELKSKFSGITETDDAKELSRKLEDKRRESNRLDEQLALMRTRLGLQDVKSPESRIPPPPPIRSLSPPSRVMRPSPGDPTRPATSLSIEHLKTLEGKVGALSGEYVSAAILERNKGRYAPRAVIADTYMRRLRAGRPQNAAVVNAAKLDQLRKGNVSQPVESRLSFTEKPSHSPTRVEIRSDQTKAPPVPKREDSNNNDSGNGPSVTSSVPSVSGNEGVAETLEDDVFAEGLPVPPPAAFDGDTSTSTATNTGLNNDFSSDSLSSASHIEPQPHRPPDASTKPRKSCLKASCDVVLYTATRPDNLSFEKDKDIPFVDSMTPGSNGLKQSVSFDPLALMLDAAMEGELNLVKQTAQQVKDVSAGNDEGSTALHNSVCSAHDEVTRFLVLEAGADVNAVDIDGWTPLHCAASCASLPMCQLLVDHGAALFLCTNGDEETALEKCDEEAEGGQRTAEYLFNAQQQLGVTNGGVVYAAFPYQAKNKDELSFDVNEEVTILKKGDAAEIEWYWARNKKGVAGYVPRNFLALHRRLIREKITLPSPKEEIKSPDKEDSNKTPPKKPERDEKSDKTAF